MQLVDGNFAVRLGGNYYINVPTLVAFDNMPLFLLGRLNDGYLGIDFEVYDAEQKKVASVKHNNIYFGDKSAYTLGGDADSLTFVSKESNETLINIRKRAAAGNVDLDVSVHTYLPNGKLLELRPDGSNLGGLGLIGNKFIGCRIGIAIGSDGSVALCSKR